MLYKTRIISLILSSILLFACDINNPTFDIKNLNGNEIIVLGHRGMSTNYNYPGNTFESISTALNIGADGAEIDVQVTKDSVLVIYHNKDLSSLTDCEGRINDFNWSELEGCKYTSKDGSNYPVITVDSLFNRIPDIHNYYFSLDLNITLKVVKINISISPRNDHLLIYSISEFNLF